MCRLAQTQTASLGPEGSQGPVTLPSEAAALHSPARSPVGPATTAAIDGPVSGASAAGNSPVRSGIGSPEGAVSQGSISFALGGASSANVVSPLRQRSLRSPAAVDNDGLVTSSSQPVEEKAAAQRADDSPQITASTEVAASGDTQPAQCDSPASLCELLSSEDAVPSRPAAIVPAWGLGGGETVFSNRAFGPGPTDAHNGCAAYVRTCNHFVLC